MYFFSLNKKASIVNNRRLNSQQVPAIGTLTLQ